MKDGLMVLYGLILALSLGLIGDGLKLAHERVKECIRLRRSK